MSDKDIESKIHSLLEAFKHDRATIVEVLKKNNYSLDEAAFELSEIPVKPVVQPIRFQQPTIQPFVPQQPVKPIQQQQPIKPQDDDEDVIYTEIVKQFGNTGLTESAIYDVHKQYGKNIDQTVRAIKTMTYNPTEEHKKMEEIQKKYELEQKIKSEKEMIERQMAEEKSRFEQEMMLREKMESVRREKEKLEQEKARYDQEMMLKERMDQEKFEKLKREKLEEMKRKVETERERLIEVEKQNKEFILKKQLEERKRLEAEQFLRKEELLRYEEAKKQEEERKRLEYEEHHLITQELLQRQEKLLETTEKESKRAAELEKQNILAQDLLRQKEESALLKELSHNKLIESQKKEILEFQMQIDILKQKEFQAQQENDSLSKKSLYEIEILRLRLAEEQEIKNKENQLKRENEELLRQQIHDLESQKEIQRIQILELENIKKKQIQDLELELQSKQNELSQTKKSNFITLQIELDQVQRDQINVEWNLESKFEANASYWIGIYPTHQPKHDRYLVFKAIKGVEGNVSFPSIIPGHYEARLFRDKYSLLQTSSSVQVGPTVNIGVHVIGDQINVTFDVPSIPNYNYTHDWVGIYTQKARNKKYMECIYTNASKSITFASPRVPGYYEVRYFVSPTKYNEQVKSTFELIDNDSVVISTPIAGTEEGFKVEYTINTIQPSTYDWVGIFQVDEDNNKNYISSKYTNGSGHGELTLNAPNKPGEYEVRFFSHTKGKYTIHKVSNRFLVTGTNY